jgi:hypothetical protein
VAQLPAFMREITPAQSGAASAPAFYETGVAFLKRICRLDTMKHQTVLHPS